MCYPYKGYVIVFIILSRTLELHMEMEMYRPTHTDELRDEPTCTF
jgi:hypothetical protein